MGPKEYDGAWEVGVDRVAIHGTKRDSRDRIVPRLSNAGEEVDRVGSPVSAARCISATHSGTSRAAMKKRS